MLVAASLEDFLTLNVLMQARHELESYPRSGWHGAPVEHQLVAVATARVAPSPAALSVTTAFTLTCQEEVTEDCRTRPLPVTWSSFEKALSLATSAPLTVSIRTVSLFLQTGLRPAITHAAGR